MAGRGLAGRGSHPVRTVAVLLALVALLGAGPDPALPAPPTAAADTVVVVVSADNPARELSSVRLADLYLGRVDRFPDGRRADPIDQSPGSEAREAFYDAFLGRSPAEVKAHWSRLVFTGRGRPPRDVPDGEAMKAAVAGDPSAIGYLDHTLVDGSLRIVRVE